MTLGHFPFTRMRRMRMKAFARELRRENSLTASDLILPVFILEGKNKTEAVSSMPGVCRYSVDKLELLVDDSSWELPKYRELLFLR